MGSVCCVAARDKTLQNRSGSEYVHRNFRHSPSWSFQWDNRTHIEDEIDQDVQLSRTSTCDVMLGFKGRQEAEIEVISDGGSPMRNFRTTAWQKSPVSDGAYRNFRTNAPDFSVGSNPCSAERDFDKSSAVANASSPKLSSSLPSTSSSSMFKVEPSSSYRHSVSIAQTPMRARRSPGYQLSRQISDSKIIGFRSPSNNSASEGKKSVVLSVCSNDLALSSHDGSSDGWSIRTFSELVASSQRERWSSDSENMSPCHGKITRSSSNGPILTPSMDFQTCGICLKVLPERYACVVVAVLVCGHVFHADCLEKKTAEVDRYDPPCPICTAGAKSTSKLSKKASRIEADMKSKNKISPIGVVDSDDIDGNAVVRFEKPNLSDGKGPKMASCSSMRSSFKRPFLRRHFSLGSKSTWVPLVNESTRKRGFWARCRKDAKE